jgi:PAS domain S-box-containing protein
VRIHAIVRYLIFIVILSTGQFRLIANSPDITLKRYQIDSVLTLLPRANQQEKVDLLVYLSETYTSISLDSSIEYARMALKSAKDLNDSNKIAECYKLLGNISYYMGNYDNVVSYYDSSLIHYRIINDSFGQAKVWNNLGIIYNNLGDYTSSINYHLKSLGFKMQMSDSIGIANSYNNIGSIYYSLEDYTTSYDYFNKSLTILENLTKTKGLHKVYNNLGLISNELGHYEKALDFFNLALESAKTDDDMMVVADVMNNIGQCQVMMGKYFDGLKSYKQAAHLYDQLGIPKSLVLNNIGQAYIELDYYKNALVYLNQALEIEINRGQLWLLRDIYHNIYIAYERSGNYKNAHFNYILYSQYSDSVKTQQFSSQIKEITTKYEEEKDKELMAKTRLEIKNRELELRRSNLINYITFGGLIITLIFVVILLRLIKLKSNTNMMLLQKNDEIMRSQDIIRSINKALTNNEEKLRSIFDVSPYSIFVLDSDSNIVDCNDTSIHSFKAHNKRELLDKSIIHFVSTETNKKSKDQLISLIKENNLNKAQFTLNRIDLSSFHASITGRVIKDTAAGKDAFVIVINDITERQTFIENLKEAKMKAEESDRLKTAFLANMSHEIRTPMNSIIGFSNLLNDPDILPDRRQEFLGHILKSISLLLSLIDDIIDISKIEAGQINLNLQKIKVNEFLTDIFNSFKQSNSDDNLTFVINLPKKSDSLSCNSDPVRLRQVLINLLSNAIKFTSSGQIEMGYTIEEANGRSKLIFYVKDTGIGIPADKHDLIFDRFRQVDDSQSRRYGGTGLGLAISKRLVEIMGGTIWVQSAPGEGSTFFVKIAYVSEQRGEEDYLSKFESGKYNWKGKTLLIAEDENSNYQLIKAALSKTGIAIERAKNGREAVDIVKSNDQIDLVLMDIRLPLLNGYDATRQIKSIRKTLPVLSITAYAMFEDEKKSFNAGCDAYISKPVKPDKLLDVINGYLKKE